ncbi:hypothetical protein ZHAS_00016752 [Anopheles sinensis]|uniref:Uncharacterized protein n=1 Tax=Anopheles sinensis TaxID=74873 RepID=A0A084WEV3_ANOSI|nr:hypothetical protein ZHAS_00016752 [Anopheles sinensis]
MGRPCDKRTLGSDRFHRHVRPNPTNTHALTFKRGDIVSKFDGGGGGEIWQQRTDCQQGKTFTDVAQSGQAFGEGVMERLFLTIVTRNVPKW